MFYDLNIRKSESLNWTAETEETIERLVKFGYKGFAITTELDESVFQKVIKEKDGKKKLSDSNNDSNSEVVPLPPDLAIFKGKFKKVKFYNRINIKASENSNIRKFVVCKNFKKYDIISFQPENQGVLKYLAGGTGEFDIISYDPETKCNISFSRKLYNQLVNQNIYFELIYGPAIIDSTARRNLLSLAHNYRAVGKSKNIIVASGARFSSHIRGPYDVINFNLLFGLSEEQSRNSVSRNCEKLLLRAKKQRSNKSTIEMIKTQRNSDNGKIC